MRAFFFFTLDLLYLDMFILSMLKAVFALKILFLPYNSLPQNTSFSPMSAAQKEKESEVAQSCLILCDPMDSSPPGSSVHEIF